MAKEIKKADLNKVVEAKKEQLGALNTRPGIKDKIPGTTSKWYQFSGEWIESGGGSKPSTIRVSKITPAQLTALTELGAKVIDKVEISVAADKMDQAKAILKK